MDNRKLIIAIDGLPGSGVSTQAELLAFRVVDEGLSVRIIERSFTQSAGEKRYIAISGATIVTDCRDQPMTQNTNDDGPFALLTPTLNVSSALASVSSDVDCVIIAGYVPSLLHAMRGKVPECVYESTMKLLRRAFHGVDHCLILTEHGKMVSPVRGFARKMINVFLNPGFVPRCSMSILDTIWFSVAPAVRRHRLRKGLKAGG